ncbi:hypothetical protein GCM10019996_04760 [Lentilactobacillus parakefiri]
MENPDFLRVSKSFQQYIIVAKGGKRHILCVSVNSQIAIFSRLTYIDIKI